MSIGGQDVVLRAPACESIADVILRACRKYWFPAGCRFQDAQEQQVHSFSDPWVWMVGTSRNEFSVYQDDVAVASWRERGATKQNANTMFHFIIGEPLAEEPSLIEVAMIFDKLTPDVRAFVSNLQDDFLFLLRAQIPVLREAA
jgi:hypothetical protein